MASQCETISSKHGSVYGHRLILGPVPPTPPPSPPPSFLAGPPTRSQREIPLTADLKTSGLDVAAAFVLLADISCMLSQSSTLTCRSQCQPSSLATWLGRSLNVSSSSPPNHHPPRTDRYYRGAGVYVNQMPGRRLSGWAVLPQARKSETNNRMLPAITLNLAKGGRNRLVVRSVAMIRSHSLLSENPRCRET